MGKYETMIKCAQVRRLLEENKHMKALELIESIDLYQVRSLSDLYLFAQVYMKADLLDKAKLIYMGIYEQHKSRQVIHKFFMLTVRTGDMDLAEKLLDEYKEMDPESAEQYILRYRLERAKGSKTEKLIEILQSLKKEEYSEEWGLKLAILYEKVGRTEECIAECDNLVLWFGEGVYVDKAKRLKNKCLGRSHTLEEEKEEFISVKKGMEIFFKKREITNFILCGEEEERMVTTIKKIVKVGNGWGIFHSPAIAKISAEKFNQINLEDKLGKLSGSCVLIQNAPKLKKHSILDIIKVMKEMSDKIVFALAGKPDDMEVWLKENMELEKEITIKMKI